LKRGGARTFVSHLSGPDAGFFILSPMLAALAKKSVVKF
jgi:hypothetical protein